MMPMEETNWVVRGGISLPTDLQKGYREHVQVQNLFGFSVQYHPGATIDELAIAGRFPHLSISYAVDTELVVAVSAIGYDVKLIASPGKGFHSTLMALMTATGVIVHILPDDLAVELSAHFKRMPNPARGP